MPEVSSAHQGGSQPRTRAPRFVRASWPRQSTLPTPPSAGPAETCLYRIHFDGEERPRLQTFLSEGAARGWAAQHERRREYRVVAEDKEGPSPHGIGG
jgi:hypothetical protein